MPRKRSDIESALKSKGFKYKSTNHHDYYKYYVDEKYTGIQTHLSRGSGYKDYSDALLSQVKKQLKLSSKQELLDLIDCPMQEEEYREILRAKGLL